MQEQLFFTQSAPTEDDSPIDRLMGVVMALAAEVYILRDRNKVLESLLEEAGIFKPDAIENYEASPQARQAQASERDAFVARVLAPVLGQEKKR